MNTTNTRRGRSRPSRRNNFSNNKSRSHGGDTSNRNSQGRRKSSDGFRGEKSRGNRRKSNSGFRGENSAGKNRRGGGRKLPSFDPSQFINQNPVEIKEDVYVAKHTFSDFGLNNQIVNTITKMGIKIPTPIQDQIIPEIMNGRDVIGLAETGTGKTAAFLAPIIDKTVKNMRNQTLILTPTRELAIQVNSEFMKLKEGFNLYSTTCVGGMNIRPQIKSLSRTNHFIIGTPGRILDLIKRGNLKTQYISTIVLDEADRMLDMGFIGDIRKILETVPKERHTLFFSATMSDEANKIVNDFLKNPAEISVKKKDITNSIAQDVVMFTNDNKYSTLTSLLSKPEFRKVIIFGSMKHSVEKLSKELNQFGIRSESLHGNKNHTQRQRALSKFKAGQAQVLVATDVAARGIHVDSVSHVINYDLPGTFNDYVHRIGRTGRANKKGMALTFVPKNFGFGKRR